MNAAYRIPNHDGYLLAGADPDQREPTDEEVSDRAAYLEPLILAKYPNPSELVAQEMGAPHWDKQLDTLLRESDDCELGRLVRRMLAAGAKAEAESLADAELYSNTDIQQSMLLKHIGATPVDSWLRERFL
jgi:hypothetical protein